MDWGQTSMEKNKFYEGNSMYNPDKFPTTLDEQHYMNRLMDLDMPSGYIFKRFLLTGRISRQRYKIVKGVTFHVVYLTDERTNDGGATYPILVYILMHSKDEIRDADMFGYMMVTIYSWDGPLMNPKDCTFDNVWHLWCSGGKKKW
jgi:hypothetical protein